MLLMSPEFSDDTGINALLWKLCPSWYGLINFDCIGKMLLFRLLSVEYCNGIYTTLVHFVIHSICCCFRIVNSVISKNCNLTN